MKQFAPGGKRRIVIVDDHPIVRQGIAQMIAQQPDMTVAGETDNAQEALRLVEQARPHLMIVDISLAGMDGLELTKLLKSRYPTLPVLILSMHDESLYAERALRAGARGYIMKRVAPENLLAAARKILKGGIFLSEAMATRLLERLSPGPAKERPASVDTLSDRELEILRLIGQGRKTGAIARELNISVKTVETYREHLKQKLMLQDAGELNQFAVRWVEEQ